MSRSSFPCQTLYYIIAFCLLTSSAFAQFTNLYDFGGSPNGMYPYATPIQVGSFVYGATRDGGANNAGLIYKSDVSGNLTTIYNFDESTAAYHGTLLYDGSVLFGMNARGGSFGHGTIYKINIDGTGYTDIYNFNYPTTGGFPTSALVDVGGVLYGATEGGGPGSYGTIFKINKDGSNFTLLATFDGPTGGYFDGGVISDGTYLYAMGREGGANSRGVIVKVKLDGTSTVKLLDFNGTNGAAPKGPLLFDGTFLWGVTQYGGASNNGVLFRILPDGTGYTIFQNFNNSTGYFMKGGLVSDGTFLYGQNIAGGTLFNGVIFKIKLDGSGFSIIHNFDQVGGGGQDPEGTMTLIGSTLYGIRSAGGPAFRGDLFSVLTNGTNYKQLHVFEEAEEKPSGGLISDGTYFYGITTQGAANNWGAVYKVKPDGTGLQRLTNFDVVNRNPVGLMRIGSTLYGSLQSGGVNDNGMLYKVNTDGTGFTDVFDFNVNANSGFPTGGLIYDGTYLYGTAQASAVPNTYGTVYKVKPDGTGYATVYTFTDYNVNGAYPQGDLILEGGFFYGVTKQGGVNNFGTVYKIKTDGTGYQQLASFDGTNGSTPSAGLYSDGTYLYGTTSEGGVNDNGTVYRVKKDGTGFEVLKDFSDDDGAGSGSQFISDGTYLYGTTQYRGINGKGTLFKIKPDGSAFGKMSDFSDGNQPGSLYSDGMFLYGVTQQGGSNGYGILFKRSIAPATSISNFTPVYGAEGTYVTINGIDFDPDPTKNSVTIDGVAVTEFVSAAPNELVVVVPAGATTGAVSVTSSGITDTSVDTFQVNDEIEQFNGTVKTCNATYAAGGLDDDDIVLTILPAAAGAKVTVTFSDSDIGDELVVIDGLDVSGTHIDTLAVDYNASNTFTYTATNPTGALTFYYGWRDSGSDWTATISCTVPALVVNTQPQDMAVCAGSIADFSVGATASGTISFNWQFSTNGNSWQDISDTGGYSGSHTPQVKIDTKNDLDGFYRCNVSAAGVTVASDPATLTINPVPAAPTVTDPPAACESSAPVLTATGGTAGHYHWFPSQGLAISGETNATFASPTVLQTTTYYVSIDNGTCESERVPVVVTVNSCGLKIYNAVSPNNDGKNDILYIENINTNNVVKIYNRWGEEVASIEGYDNNKHVFNGLNKHGNKLPSGTYYYKISIKDQKDITGFLELKY